MLRFFVALAIALLVFLGAPVLAQNKAPIRIGLSSANRAAQRGRQIRTARAQGLAR